MINIELQKSSNITAPQAKSFADYLKNPFPVDFSFTEKTENNLQQMICKLKTKPSSGPDKIKTILLKKIHVHLLKPLTFIINQSINQRIFSEKIKIAIICLCCL